jgi:hypothetical protein
MSLKLGNTPIAGISQNTKYNAHHLLDFKWTDCIMNDVSWLRADTFSWQSGDVYVTAYNHLVQDVQGIIAQTETIGSYTVTFYRATDGHKICLADQETTIANIYSETGIAWYYILDTTNIQFKLPRTKYGFEGLRGNVGDKIDESLPNINGTMTLWNTKNRVYGMSGAFAISSTDYNESGLSTGSGWGGSGEVKWLMDASLASPTYQDNAPVQERATQMYLYFYVGDYSQTAIEQTAGLNAELFNGKVDLPVGRNQSSVGLLVENYVNGTSWYRVYSDGWCEQGGRFNANNTNTTASYTVNLLKSYIDVNYSIVTCGYSNHADQYKNGVAPYSFTTSSFVIQTYNNDALQPIVWQACGYIR